MQLLQARRWLRLDLSQSQSLPPNLASCLADLAFVFKKKYFTRFVFALGDFCDTLGHPSSLVQLQMNQKATVDDAAMHIQPREVEFARMVAPLREMLVGSGN